jgi:hypothetical protein
MQVVDNASAETIEHSLDRLGCGRTTKEGQDLLKAIRTDGWRSYGKATKSKTVSQFIKLSFDIIKLQGNFSHGFIASFPMLKP